MDIPDADWCLQSDGLPDSGNPQAHFGLWAITKSTLILGSKVSALSAAQLAVVSNKGLIAVNQDPLGVQARKVRGV